MSADNNYESSFVTQDAAVEMTALLLKPNRQYKFLQEKNVSKASMQQNVLENPSTLMSSPLLGKFVKDLLSQVKLPLGDLEEVATVMSPHSIHTDDNLKSNKNKSYTGPCYEFSKLKSAGSDAYNKVLLQSRYDSRASCTNTEYYIESTRVGGLTEYINNLGFGKC